MEWISQFLNFFKFEEPRTYDGVNGKLSHEAQIHIVQEMGTTRVAFAAKWNTYRGKEMQMKMERYGNAILSSMHKVMEYSSLLLVDRVRK